MTDRLNENELKILKFLNRDSAQIEALAGSITKEAIAMKLSIKTDMPQYINRLKSKELIEELNSINDENICYKITIEGKNYLEFLKTDRKDKLKWSVLIPIVITLTTNLIIELTKSLF